MKQVRVLLVEHQKHLAELLTKILVTAGYEVSWLPGQNTTTRQLAQFNPDVLVIDLETPQQNSEVLQTVRRLSRPGIIVLSQSENRRDAEAAIQLGADHYMVKRWLKPSQLVHAVKNLAT